MKTETMESSPDENNHPEWVKLVLRYVKDWSPDQIRSEPRQKR